MRLALACIAILAAACSSLESTLAQTLQPVQWGYSYQCPINTLDYPCLVRLNGTAFINPVLVGSGASAYYQMSSFVGTRTYTNRYQQSTSVSVTLAPLGENGAENWLVIGSPFNGEVTFRLGSLIQFPGGLFGNEIQLFRASGASSLGYVTEGITINATNYNSLNPDPATFVLCSTAPGFMASAYVASTQQVAFSTSMSACTSIPSAFSTAVSSLVIDSSLSVPGVRAYTLMYTVTDASTFTSSVNAQVYTDGTINYDQLGNIYYNVIAITGSRTEQSLTNSSLTSNVLISSLMAQNQIFTSNLNYISNNNRIYPQYPFLDRYGLAYTLTTTLGQVVANAELSDGSDFVGSNVVGVYVYRSDTIEEQGLSGTFTYPPFNALNARSQALSLTPLTVPSVYNIYSFCYVMYGLPQTLDYPWSVVVSVTVLLNTTQIVVNYSTPQYGISSLPAYNIVGLLGTRTYTNRYNVSLVSSLTADALAEDANVGLLVPVSPYAPANSVSYHLNSTIQTPGGLPATDMSFFLDPYPIEGTAASLTLQGGVGTGTNALNNDPSRTLFVSNIPGFTASTYSNSNRDTLAGTVAGTTDLSQCKAVGNAVLNYNADDLVTGVRSYALYYNFNGSAGYNVQGALNVVTDGTVQIDQLGNVYYTINALSGYRLYYAPNGTLLSNTTAASLLPLCSGPSPSNLAIYCNNNRLYPQYPFVDRLGLAYQTGSFISQDGATTPSLNEVGLCVYRHTILEETHTANGGTAAFTDSPTAIITLTRVSNLATQYISIQLGYVMYCLPSSLEYPCAVQVIGTAVLALANQPIITTCPTNGDYGPLCNQRAYVLSGFTGNRTFFNKYGGTNVSFVSLSPVNEDYADQLLYPAQPYVDSDGITLLLNFTAGSQSNGLLAQTTVMGGLSANLINLFLNTPSYSATEGIAFNANQVSGGSIASSALNYDSSRTIICSTLPGFTSASYNASNNYPAGSNNMAACTPVLPSALRLPTFKQGVTYTYTLAYSVSDGATFTIQTVATVVSNGNAYFDGLGNRFILPISATGTRTYYNLSSGVTTASTIIGVASVGTVLVASSGTATGYLNSNRVYPFNSNGAFVSQLGLSFTLATPAPLSGNDAVLNSTISITYYKDGTLEEYPYSKLPNAAYQNFSIVAGTTAPVLPAATPVQWGYTYQCPINTLDYPCLVRLIGTAFINPVLVGLGASAYYQMSSFVGTRTYTNRYQQSTSVSVTLAPLGENGAENWLVIGSPFNGEVTFRLGSLIQFPGGLFGNEIQLFRASGASSLGYVTEGITINATNYNSLNPDPATFVLCSTAPGFMASAYVASTQQVAFSTSMSACTSIPSAFSTAVSSLVIDSSLSVPGVRAYTLMYTVTDASTFTSSVNAQVYTDGTINYDQLGNIYYNVIAITGSRTEQSLTNSSLTSNVLISSLMAQNQIFTSNLNYISNNNRIYPQYPFLDRYGLAYTLTTTLGQVVANAELSDGSDFVGSNVVGVYVYRSDTIEEQGLSGTFTYPPFNALNARSQALSLTPLTVPSVYNIYSFCYVMYGLPQTLDYPWSVVVSVTVLLNTTQIVVNYSTPQYGISSLPAYNIVGLLGTRTYTNRYNVSLVSSLTADALAEDANVGLLVPVSPYAPANSVSYHLNSTIQTPGGLPATDMSFFLDPYPIEGTAASLTLQGGVGTGTNALNNDPSRTLFVSNIPGFTASTYSNSNRDTLAGTVAGTTDLSQCKAVGNAVLNYNADDLVTGVRSYALYYNFNGSAGYNVQGALNVVTDGTVQIDQLGNVYYTINALSGYRLYYAPNGTLLSNTTAASLLPLCSGPSPSNLAIYCNNNRLYPQYPFVDRLGLAYQTGSFISQDGATTPSLNEVGLCVYRHTILEETHTANGGTAAFTDSPTAIITLTRVSNLATQYISIQLGYVMYCLPSSLEYPCAVQVLGTAVLALANQPIITTCPTNGDYGPLCNQRAYVLSGFTGNRTFFNKYGGTNVSFVSLSPVNEDYADQLLYPAQPYVDSDGITLLLNFTAGSQSNGLLAQTTVMGGLSANLINLFLNTPSYSATEGIAFNANQVSGGSIASSALNYDSSRTIICSTLPGFTSASYNASNNYPAGSNNMAACTPVLPSALRLPTFKQGVTYTYTLAYSVSDGATFTIQTVATVVSNGNAYFDGLGNRFILPISATGTRTYYNLSSGVTTASTIIGVASVGTVLVASSGTATGYLNSNRVYPFNSNGAFVSQLGLSFTLATPAPLSGNDAVLNSTISITYYKDGTLEEYPYSKLPNAAYQNFSIVAGTTAPVLPAATPVQWGYTYQCPINTLDYPCLVRLIGTAFINPVLVGSGASAYYQMSSFVGTRTYTNRYQQSTSVSVTLAPLGENGAENWLVIGSPFNGEVTFRLGSLIQFPGGLFGNEIQLFRASGASSLGYVTEGITINATNYNSLNPDPATFVLCSTAPGFMASAYVASTQQVAFSTSMSACTSIPSAFSTAVSSLVIDSSLSVPGVRAYTLMYTVTDASTFTSSVNAQVYTDGTINYDQLGNIYYNVIAITGSRTEQSLTNSSLTSNVLISSLMAQNQIFTSNLNYISNNNRIYPQYPFLDRYGLAYTLTTTLGQVVANAELSDGSDFVGSNVVGVYVYRSDTIEEQGLSGTFTYPPFNALNARSQALSLTPLTVPSVYNIYSFCYVMYGLPQTLDYPWSVVVSVTVLLNTTQIVVNYSTPQYGISSLPAYNIVGLLGTRTYTNRYNVSLVSSLTADALAEDANVGLLVPVSPYAPANSVSYHLNSTIQTPGGLPATDMSFFLDPYPIEGTAASLTLQGGVGTGTNALNNDPSRTLFVSNIPGFTASTYSNSNRDTLAGTVAGTTDLSQCKAVGNAVLNYNADDLVTGVRSYALYYNFNGSAGYNVQGALNVVTDGTVQIDQLGNVYYTINALSGYRLYYAPNGTLLSNTTAASLLPLCSGPSPSNLAIYCNNNRLYPQYPFVDRLGLAYQTGSFISQDGATTPSLNEVGLCVYRHTILEETHTANGGTAAFTDSPTAIITLTRVSNLATQYISIQLGYVMYCLPSSLEYPCAVQVLGTAVLALANQPIITTCPTNGDYGPLCNQRAYVLSGFTGNRTFFNKYGGTNVSFVSLSPVNEDYADQLLYPAQPYVDSDGITLLLNFTAGSQSNGLLAQTTVMGGLSANLINLFLNTPSYSATEGIAFNANQVSGGSIASSALNYDSSRTIICSTLPGFTSASYNASNNYPAGSNNMAACTPVLPSALRLPTFKQGVTYTYTLAYSVSDGATFTIQTVATVVSNGNAYFDGLGNRFILPISATGTRTYYNLSSGVTTASTIIGVASVGTVLVASSGTATGYLNSNRVYPFNSNGAFVSQLGLSFTLATPAPLSGNDAVLNSTISITYYKDGTLEEYPYSKLPNAAYQNFTIVAGTSAPALPPVRASSSSSSSSGGSISSGGSSSSSPVISSSSSTGGSTVDNTYPPYSASVTFNAGFPSAITSSNYYATESNFKLDVASNLASSLGASATSIAPFFKVSINSNPAARRRLLQQTNSYPVQVVILGNISSIDPSADPTQVAFNAAKTLANKIQNGTFTTTASGANVPSNQSPQVTALSSPSSSSSSLSGGQIAGIVVGTVIGALLLVVVLLFLCFSSLVTKGKGGVPESEDSSFRVSKLPPEHSTNQSSNQVNGSVLRPSIVEMQPVETEEEV